MRIVWSGILVVLMFASGVMSSGLVRAQAAPADYLPSSLFLPHADCFRIEGESVLDFAGIVARFSGVPDAATVLSDLGWQAGAYRQYACDTPPPGQAGWIDISVHQFATEAGAQAAAPFFAEAKLLGTALQMVPGTTAVTGPASNGTEYTQYVTYGNILFRVTGVAPSGSPQHDVEQVATMQIAGAAVIAGREQRADAPPAAPTGSFPYTITDLGTGNGNWSSAREINERGQILWTWATGRQALTGVLTTNQHVLVWENGVSTDLTFMGMSRGIALNDLGAVLGAGDVGSSVLYSPGKDLISPVPGFIDDAYPAAMNNTGAIVGNSQGRAVVVHGMQSIELLPPVGFEFLEPAAINAAGHIAATARLSRTNDTVQRAVLYVDGVATVLGPAPDGISSSASDLNDVGQLVGGPERRGMHSIPMEGHAFLYDHNTGLLTDLGTLPGYTKSISSSINNAGQVVGFSWSPVNPADAARRAYIFESQTGTMTDLNRLIDPSIGWLLQDALDINDAGQIVGAGQINGETHAFLLTPNP